MAHGRIAHKQEVLGLCSPWLAAGSCLLGYSQFIPGLSVTGSCCTTEPTQQNRESLDRAFVLSMDRELGWGEAILDSRKIICP